ncbi:hypothetical protein METBIDRAFT_11465 [Metschnikowia bicuspidata var. bicuspidata NRRL YB-4993]|uniref:Nuclear pore complex protein Nup85 n=1 Tax=Metschnikowia bicuspidata var. bicuspidata NRRL YB-4993 TaxID=869754 RepID=A0A1A0HA10_9ASCO|nr:hypothetical protein METBIDRAFT_11465 [Metschnikowia bicuspidata var. bicuspidata NRRL YB-4993]OBA20851.1 hypothetical protein METBIDRAFT_11465 [Metschnikowia bicuspidata var. bicuspidata NRRL YB-4993]
MQFEDIEMLEVPDDLSVTLENHTESISDSGSDQHAVPAKEYPSFQEWLEGQKNIQFQFNKSEYKKSYTHPSDFGNAQSAYITSLYKSVEALAAQKIGILAAPADDEAQIGVISSAKNFGKSKERQHNDSLINSAFCKLVEAFSAFYDTVKYQVSDDEARNYESLASLLGCIQANWFALSERQKPEEIAEWVNRYDPKPENDFIDAVMYNNPTPYTHSQFWTSYMGTLLARGMFEQAESSLRACKYEALEQECPELYVIIQDFTTLVGNYQVMALKGQFAEWKYTVCEFRENYKTMKAGITDLAHTSMALQIHDLLCLLSGFPKTTASFVSTWYEMYAALALFQVRDDESVYPDYYRLAIAEKGSNVSSELEQAFRDVISQKFLRVVLAVDSHDPATAAYVSKLLELKGFFSSYYVDVTEKMLDGPASLTKRYVSDYLLTRHAYECLEVHQLVPVGLGILLTPVVSESQENTAQSKLVVSEFLPQYQCSTNDDLEWALTICAKLGLTGIIRKLFLKQGEKSLKDGHLFEALNMLVGCYEETVSSEETASALADIQHIVWDLLFQDCLLNSTPVPDELLMNIVLNNVDPEFKIHSVIRQCIAPYAVLAEFFMAATDVEGFSQNVSRLFHLIRFNYMPRKFTSLLLAQFLPLIPKQKFEMPQLVIITELIDAFEAHWKADPEDCNELYEFAVENVPQDVNHDWRVQLQRDEQQLPASVNDLIRDLREKIVAKIGMVYIRT